MTLNCPNSVLYTLESVSLNELNYAPEIASAMLKKQQARALIDARQLIVKGAVDIAQTAVARCARSRRTIFLLSRARASMPALTPRDRLQALRRKRTPSP